MEDYVNRRFRTAVAIVIALLALVFVIEAIWRTFGPHPYPAEDPPSQSPPHGLNASALIDAADPYRALEQLEHVATTSEANLSEALAEEVGLLPGARDVRSDTSGTVIGYLVDIAADEALDQLNSHMEHLGWAAVPTGPDGGATYVKREGRCTWALATCVQVGQSTSIVIRCVIS